MSSVLNIYKKNKIIPNLQKHQFKVAAVGLYLVENWRAQEKINKKSIITALLFHDMGNIIKFRLDQFKHLLGKEADRLNYWKNVQKDFIEKFGRDEHLASIKIAKQLKLDKQAILLIKNMGTSNLQNVYHSIDFNLKICSYSDLRVGPNGILTVNERFDDLIERYKGSGHSIGNISQTELNRKYTLKIEKQLQSRVTIDLQQLSDRSLRTELLAIKEYELK